MLKSRFIVRSYSIFFLILILCSLVGSSSRLLVGKEYGKKQEVTAKANVSQSESGQGAENQEQEVLIEKPFHAVVNAGLQWDFHKHFCLVVAFVVFFVPKTSIIPFYKVITPLPYFVTLFHTSICVNAP